MFRDDDLQNHLETSSVVKTQSAVIAEWNMNIPENIYQIGNYRYRPRESESIYNTINNSFDKFDVGNFYTNATDADVIVDGGFDDLNTPQLFTSIKEKNKLIYSLEECFNHFRPRSGINKATYFDNKFLHHSNPEMASRPRYYMPNKEDLFKYWTSYRTEEGVERGIASIPVNGQNYIDDAAPFVVYEEPVPANRIVVKMQTNVGTVNLGPFTNESGSFADPLFGFENKTTPVKWKIQYLENNNWVDAYSFNQSSLRNDGSQVIKEDGYLEISYGLVLPERYRNIFIYAGTYASTSLLPESNRNGFAYLIKNNEEDLGVYHIWVNDKYEEFVPFYGWDIHEETVYQNTHFVRKLTNPDKFNNNSGTQYREFQYIQGLRVVVETMNKFESTFDLIELSPRLTADISDIVTNFSIKKTAGDLGTYGLPVGRLLVSDGVINIFDVDQIFNENNPRSIVREYLGRNIQIKTYEVIVDIDGYDYYIPLKTLYSEGFPTSRYSERSVELNCRDLYFYLESLTAPELLLTNVSTSYAVATLLDYIGISNYSFKRLEGESENIIPFFFVKPDQTVAEVLQDIAISTQTSMFFDEYNNFIMMSKNYMLPGKDQRPVDFSFSGNDGEKLANIIEISSQDKDIYNDGKINFTSRYIQRSYGSIRQASLVDQEKTWIYKPVLLWEVAPTEQTKSINNESASQASYVLSAVPLNSDLSESLPEVVNRELVNNIVDLGEGVYWLSKFDGYFYANGEIIRFDAVEFNVSGVGNVWISSNREYQNYFSKVPFNGKIYPTGLVRIYTELDFEEIDGVTKITNGPVAKHGRGQFGTPVVEHYAGLNPYWSNNNVVRGCSMRSNYLFGSNQNIPTTTLGAAGVSNSIAQQTSRNGIIKNFLATSYLSDSDVNNLRSTQTGTIQSSALIMNGPSLTTTQNPTDLVSYVYKPLDNRYKHFGTRMRIVGRIENNENRSQTPSGSNTYYVVPGSDPTQSVNISGGSGGLGIMINPETNNGYYFEIIALTETNIDSFISDQSDVHNVVFYKIKKDANSSDAIPVKLYGGLAKIIVDDGKFTGQYRMSGEENPTVYDLSVEYIDLGNIRRFYLYINNKLITTVDDTDPLPVYNNMSLFVRGSSRCMFENIYAITNNYSQNTSYAIDTPVNSVFGDKEIDVNESFRKYAMSSVVQSTYLSGVSPSDIPKYNMYFEEFGTIMREAAYLNVKYDKAYPALYAQISPTFNKIKGYAISGFYAGAYGAEFLIFNCTDTALNLDETSGNYLRIQGVTFTQESTEEYTFDDYFNNKSNFNQLNFDGNPETRSPLVLKKQYQDIKFSRMNYGKKEFNIDPLYIQTEDDAKDMMSWIIDKTTVPRKSVGLSVFAMPIIQLGDIVTIDYNDNQSLDVLGSANKKFVVYNIDYSKTFGGPTMNIYISEVGNG
jgi:hypothetical protein